MGTREIKRQPPRLGKDGRLQPPVESPKDATDWDTRFWAGALAALLAVSIAAYAIGVWQGITLADFGWRWVVLALITLGGYATAADRLRRSL